MDPENIHTHSMPWRLIGNSKGEALGRGGGGRSPLPTFLIYSLYKPKMNISKGAVVGQTNKLSLGNMDTLEQDTVKSEA